MLSAREMSKPGARKSVRVHVASLRSQSDVFRVTPERFAAAAARHPDVGQRVDVDFSWDFEGFAEAIADADALIGWRFPQDDLADLALRLKWIQLTGAGLEHLQPLDWLPPDVTLTTNSGAHAPKAAEFATMAILMLNNNLPQFVTNQRNARWEQRFGTGIEGKTLAIVGVGAMGGAAAQWVKQRLKMKVLGVRRSGRGHRYVDEMVRPNELDRILPRADFVLVTAPLTRETEGLIGARALASMKQGAGIVNMGRARVIDYDALADNLRRGRLSGAILDVFDPEPLPAESPLWSTPNLIIVPHVSSDDTAVYMDRTLDVFFDNVARFLSNRPLRNRVVRSRQY
ncbi:MAG: D-2-hydroxyacid dehydrogenase [Alphaproteobacteria bacterium]